VFKAAAAVGLIADALCDPDLSTNTTLRYSPATSTLQKEQFAERYLRFGRPAAEHARAESRVLEAPARLKRPQRLTQRLTPRLRDKCPANTYTSTYR